MTVYVLVCDYVDVDGGDFTTDIIGVYKTFEQAQKVMEKSIIEIRNEFDYCDFEEEKDGAVSGTWSIWENGEYASHHCDMFIQRKKVE